MTAQVLDILAILQPAQKLLTAVLDRAALGVGISMGLQTSPFPQPKYYFILTICRNILLLSTRVEPCRSL